MFRRRSGMLFSAATLELLAGKKLPEERIIRAYWDFFLGDFLAL